MVRMTVVLAVALVIVVGCGGTPELTGADVKEMGQERAITLLECQATKVAKEMGPFAAEEYVIDKSAKARKEDGPPVQVILWRVGYKCPEYL
jgi:hypothetical protein